MACAGIDFGSRNCVVAIARRGGVDICCNEVSNRVTPSMVAFSGSERHIGESAMTFAAQNYKNTVDNIIRLVGAHHGSDYTKKELKHAAWKGVSSDEIDGEGTVAAKVVYNDQDKLIRMEAIAAMMLTKLMEIASNEYGSSVKDVVISVPGYFVQTQRQGVLDACRIAGIKPLRLMNEHAAIALSYGIFRTSELPEKDPIKVAFVDVGSASTCVCIASFTKSRAKILSVAFEHAFGGRDLDEVLMEHFNKEIKEKYGIDPLSKPRPKMRLRKECEKLKKILSANAEGIINVECLMDDKDVAGKLKRDDFEKLLEPLTARLKACAEKAVADSGLEEGGKVHAVELVGGSTRVPLIRRTIESVFEKFGASLKTTLNLDEAVARGCAMMSAMLSPAFKVRDYDIIDITNNCIMIDKSFFGNTEKIRLVKEHHIIPTLKALTFPATGNIELLAKYKNDTFEGSYGKEISGVELEVPKEEDSTVRVKIRVTANGLLEWHSAQTMKEVEETIVVQVPVKEEQKEATTPATMETDGEAKEVTEGKPDVEMTDTEKGSPQEKVPKANGKQDSDKEAKPATAKEPEPPAKPAAPKTVPEERKVKKTKYADVKMTPRDSSISLSEGELEQCRKDEQEMRAADREVKERADALNGLESFVYDIRSRLGDSDGDLAPYSPVSVREELKKELDANETWIYSEEGDAAPKEEFVNRLAKIKEPVSKILARKKDDDERPSYIGSLERTFETYKKLAAPNPEYDHIPKEKVEEALKCVEDASTWLKDMKAKQDATSKEVDPVLICDMLKQKRTEVQNVCKPIMNTPKPKPKPEPKKEEEGAAKKDGSNEESKAAEADGKDTAAKEDPTSEAGKEKMEVESPADECGHAGCAC
eukprot:Plantae.Rhodophyta-Hildenbrandia_rubra.ctg23509.p1 GENE.Plantae.Rhodophyta-Hildenbrandia_rubra.ctg23509~~Plantae.Rhodophyta-Hildenbrandia_rubra.ctg23509.p1  ORF type:complete len:876 (-),score=225.18 Plantae.Rhodophyta-Hildenbrandia_rubra.ctg23509:235-2862(-)